MNETPWVHAGERPLQGILTRPTGESTPETPLVVLLTGGILPRVGPHRFYVKLARRLAACGFPVLRFDFAGLTNPRDPFPESISHAERVRDARLVLDDFEARQGCRRFVLIGMCRSATPAFSLALADRRVTHGVFLNGQHLSEEERLRVAASTHGRYRLRHYRERLWRPASWRRLLTGQTRYGNLLGALGRRLGDKLRPRPCPRSLTPAAPDSYWHRLAESPLQALVIHAQGCSSFDVFEMVHRPVLDALGPLPNLTVAFLPGSDHTLTPLASQAEAIGHIERWLRENAAACGSAIPSKS